MNDLYFITAQPDIPYFHWQVELYVHNFLQKGIKMENIIVLFGIVDGNTKPHINSIELVRRGVKVYYYIDDRPKKHYIPSLKPYLLYRFLKDFPEYGKKIFYHDSDIMFRELPDLKSILDDDICYASNTNGYLNYDYLLNCSKRYQSKHESYKTNELINKMCYIVGIEPDVVFRNNNDSGGAQYLLKDMSWEIWLKIYKDSIRLYDYLLTLSKDYPLDSGHIQFWTAEMWSTLWNLWYFNKNLKVIDILDFSWATDNVKEYNKKNILHMAGVTEDNGNDKFYKGAYILQNPIEQLYKDKNHFNYINKRNSTIKYIELMKSYLKKPTF